MNYRVAGMGCIPFLSFSKNYETPTRLTLQNDVLPKCKTKAWSPSACTSLSTSPHHIPTTPTYIRVWIGNIPSSSQESGFLSVAAEVQHWVCCRQISHPPQTRFSRACFSLVLWFCLYTRTLSKLIEGICSQGKTNLPLSRSTQAGEQQPEYKLSLLQDVTKNF